MNNNVIPIMGGNRSHGVHAGAFSLSLAPQRDIRNWQIAVPRNESEPEPSEAFVRFSGLELKDPTVMDELKGVMGDIYRHAPTLFLLALLISEYWVMLIVATAFVAAACVKGEEDEQ